MPASYTYAVGPDGKMRAQAVPVAGQLHTPEGRPTPIKIDAAGNRIADTEAQLKILTAIDPPDYRLPPEKAYVLAVVNAQLAQQDAAPGTAADALLDDMRAMGAVDDAVSTVITDAKGDVVPPTPAEHAARVAAAARLAASLGLQLVQVADDPLLKVPPHLEIRQCGYCYAAGDLATIESRLAIDAKQRAARDRAVALASEKAAQRARAQAEAIASSPAARLARLEAKLAAAGLAVD